MADVIKLCESHAFIATGGINLTGGRNAWAGGTGTPSNGNAWGLLTHFSILAYFS